MSAIIKTIPVHSQNLSPLFKYCQNKDKTSFSTNKDGKEWNFGDTFAEEMSPLKALIALDDNHKDLLVTGVKCSPYTAVVEFDLAKQKYKEKTGNAEIFEPFEYRDRRTGNLKTVQRAPVIAIHMIQSFGESNLDPRVVHQIGVELLERLGLQGVVDTHMNKKHSHNHIVINTYLENGKKWNCDQNERLRVREISDEIQREYGIEIDFDSPREQQAISKGKNFSYKEWMENDAGLSWKDQIKRDIQMIASVAETKEDFLSIMEEYGYKVKSEKETVITYETEDGKKINDTTLGKEYTAARLYGRTHMPKTKEVMNEYFVDTISVAKYNADGSRRGFLEMLLRKIIALIQRLKAFNDNIDNYYTTYTAAEKIRMLKSAQKTIVENGIDTVDDLEKAITDAGEELRKTKGNMKNYDAEKNLFDILEAALNDLLTLKNTEIEGENMILHNYTEEDVRKNKSKVAPMTPALKRELAIALEKTSDRLSCSYKDITIDEAKSVIDFLNEKMQQKPEILVDEAEYNKRRVTRYAKKICEKKRQRLYERFSEKAKPEDIAKMNDFLEKSGYKIRVPEKATVADIMDVRNCVSQNPFAAPLLDEDKQKQLQSIMNDKGINVYRPLSLITEKECRDVLNYIRNPKMRKPNILEEYAYPDEGKMKSLKEIMELKSITTTVPLEEMSDRDIETLYSYAVYSGEEPVISQGISKTNEEKDDEFNGKIQNLSLDEMLLLMKVRDALNVLREYGFDVDIKDDLTYINEKIKAWKEEYSDAKLEYDNAADRYHDLIKAKQMVDKAKDQEFVFGKGTQKQKIEVKFDEKEERDVEEKEEPIEETKEKKSKER